MAHQVFLRTVSKCYPIIPSGDSRNVFQAHRKVFPGWLIGS